MGQKMDLHGLRVAVACGIISFTSSTRNYLLFLL